MENLQTVDDIVATTLLEMAAPASEAMRLTSFALDFVRDLQKAAKTTIPNRDKEYFVVTDRYGYQEIPLPNDYFELISAGTQIGRVVKGLAYNSYVTSHKYQEPPRYLQIQAPSNEEASPWVWGLNSWWGMGWGTDGVVQAYGNGYDYGDFSIDLDRKLIITSPTWRWKNIVFRYYPNCITPSGETCIHTWFIAPLKYWLNWKYWFMRGDSRWQVAKVEYEKEFMFALQSVYRKNVSIPTIVKTIERTRGYRHG